MQVKRANEAEIVIRTTMVEQKERIGLFFKYNLDLIKKVKQLDQRQYEVKKQYWHIPYTKLALQAAINLDAHVYIDDINIKLERATTSPGTLEPTSSTQAETGIAPKGCEASTHAKKIVAEAVDIFSNEIEKTKIRYSSQRFYISTPYKRAIVSTIKKMDQAWWHQDSRRWIVKGSISNLERIQTLFDGIWSTHQVDQLTQLIQLHEHPRKMILYKMPDTVDQIAVQLKGYGIDIAIIKSMPNRQYQKSYRRWVIPNDRRLVERLIAQYESKGVEIINRLEPCPQLALHEDDESLAVRQKRFIAKFSQPERPIVLAVTDRMIQMRYSWRTAKAYVGPILAFKKMLGQGGLKEATSADVNRHLAQLSAQKVSESLIHRHVNAIKFYYEKVLFSLDMQIEQIKRPKKSHYLPRILSKQEVARMIQTTENVKHRTILITLYASGLRLGELLRLKLADIRWDRNQLFVSGAKGKKDRVVMLGASLKAGLQAYCEEHKPVVYLFEGIKPGSRYSDSSVQQIVKRAARHAKISQRVTPHTLRHCFATHLHDDGISIKFIQELLGHAKVETTMIYTHVSTNAVTSISSPLDSLEIDKKP